MSAGEKKRGLIIHPELHVFFRHAHHSHCTEKEVVTPPEKLQEVQAKGSEPCILCNYRMKFRKTKIVKEVCVRKC